MIGEAMQTTSLQKMLDEDESPDFPISGTFTFLSVNISRPVRVIGASSSSSTERTPHLIGNLYVQSDGVQMEDLSMVGSIFILSGVSEFKMENCFLEGSIKIEQGVSNVKIDGSELKCNGERGVAISIHDGRNVSIRNSVISGFLVGVCITKDIYMTSPPFVQTGEMGVWITESCFRCNQTDIVMQMPIRSNQESSRFAIMNFADILKLEDTVASTFDVSLSGRFEVPISFTEWPVPLQAMDKKSYPRRGFKSNGRLCHFKLLEGLLIMEEDPMNPNVKASKRKRRMQTRFSRSDIYYSSVLGIDAGSSKEVINSAYKRLALRNHPDKDGGDNTQFIQIKEARDKLIEIIDAR